MQPVNAPTSSLWYQESRSPQNKARVNGNLIAVQPLFAACQAQAEGDDGFTRRA